MVRRQNLAMAIRAPVLPAETQTVASPVFTDSIAFHIEDFQRPARSAWLGLSSMRTTTSEWTMRAAAASWGWGSSRAVSRASSPCSRKRSSGRRLSAIAAPGITMSGPASPPIASREIVICFDISKITGVGPTRRRRHNIRFHPRGKRGAGRVENFGAFPYHSLSRRASAAKGESSALPSPTPAASASKTAPSLRG